MKYIILAVFLMACFTTHGHVPDRALSGINPTPDLEVNSTLESKKFALFDWFKSQPETEDEKRRREERGKNWLEKMCRNDCSSCLASWQCREKCEQEVQRILHAERESLMVAGIGEAHNPFEMLNEIQKEASGEGERPLMLADDYEDCMDDCTCNGGSSKGCHQVCK